MLVLFILFALSYATYNVSIYTPVTQNCEGITVSKKTKSLLVTQYYGGVILELDGRTPYATQVFAPNIQGQLTGIKVNHKGQRYVCLHAPGTEFNGVWRIEEGASNCSSIDSPGCVKLFPRRNESILFPDGLAITRDGNNYTIFVSDPPSGNIWVFRDEGKDSRGKLLAGTDTGITPNYLQGLGVIFPLGSDFNPIGRGFGCNGLSYDETNDKLYVAVAETALVVSMKVNRDASGDYTAGTQTVVGNQGFFLQYIFDGIFYEDGVVYVTVVADLSTGGLLGGHKVLSINLRESNPSWKVLIDDVLLGTPTDIVSGCGVEHPNANCSKLFIVDIAGFGLSMYGPNILVAEKI